MVILSNDPERPHGLAEVLHASPLVDFRTMVAEDLGSLQDTLQGAAADVVVVDAALPDPGPAAVIEEVRENAPQTPVAWLVDPMQTVDVYVNGLDDIVVWPDTESVPADHVVVQALQRHRMFARLEDRRVELRTLVYGLTHDLRAPLISLDYLVEQIGSAVRSTQDLPPPLADLPETVAHASRTLDRMASFVEDILRVAEITASKPADRPVPLRAIVDSVLEDLAELAARRRVEVRREIPDLQVVGDRPRLYHMLHNLIHNAVRHTPTGGTATVLAEDLPTDTDLRGLRLSVLDAGDGLPRDLPPHSTVQEMLLRHPPRPGHGLGLQVAIIGATHHNAEIRVANHPEGGACFYVDLPPGRVLRST